MYFTTSKNYVMADDQPGTSLCKLHAIVERKNISYEFNSFADDVIDLLVALCVFFIRNKLSDFSLDVS